MSSAKSLETSKNYDSQPSMHGPKAAENVEPSFQAAEKHQCCLEDEAPGSRRSRSQDHENVIERMIREMFCSCFTIPKPRPYYNLPRRSGNRVSQSPSSLLAERAHDEPNMVTSCHSGLPRQYVCGIYEDFFRYLQYSFICRIFRSEPFNFSHLSPNLSPPLLTQMHEAPVLMRFATDCIQQWIQSDLTVLMTCGQNTMPTIAVRVSEFEPQGSALLSQIQYVISPETQQRIAVQKQSPPLGMRYLEPDDEKSCDEYITCIVDEHLDSFSELCWQEEDVEGFQEKLLKLMANLSRKVSGEAKLLHEVLRLIVVTFIMSHTLTMAEEGKFATLSQMSSYLPKSYDYEYTSPRLTNRQLKFFFSRLQRSIQANVLYKLQQNLNSKDCNGWVAAFTAVVGLCMAQEDRQITIHSVMSTLSHTEGIGLELARSQAVVECDTIEKGMLAIQDMFLFRYSRECEFLRNQDPFCIDGNGLRDTSSVTFVQEVLQLTKENLSFLNKRQQVPLSHDNQTKYSARLVAKFLLSILE